MLDDLKKDIQQIAGEIQERMTPQWAAPQKLCHFNRGSQFWEFNYQAPLPQGKSGGLLTLSRNGKERFSISLRQPESELALWRDGLHEVLAESDQRGVGWWMRFYLRLRGRRIDCCRLVTRDESIIGGTCRDVERYYVARLAGWTRPSVIIVNTAKYSASRKTSYTSSSVRLLPSECQQMAAALQHLTQGPAPKPLAPLPRNLFNQQPGVSVKLIAVIIIVVTALMVAATLLPLSRLLFHR